MPRSLCKQLNRKQRTAGNRVASRHWHSGGTMPRVERVREVLADALTQAYIDRKSGEGWKPVTIVWERQVEGAQTEPANITEEPPYGLKIAEDCTQLEQDIQEKEALLLMLEMIIQDKPLSEIAESLNQRGLTPSCSSTLRVVSVTRQGFRLP